MDDEADCGGTLDEKVGNHSWMSAGYIFATAAALSPPLCCTEPVAGLAGPLSCPCTRVHSAAIHLTSALTSSYPSKYVQRQENTQGKWRFSASGFWAGTSNSRGAQSGDMDSLLSLVKYLSVGLLLEILGFIDCSKGCWLILKAVFDKLRLLGLWSQQTIKCLVDI